MTEIIRVQHSWKQSSSKALCGEALGSGAILLRPHPDFPVCPECERQTILVAMQDGITCWFLESTREAQRARDDGRGAIVPAPRFGGIR